MVTLTLMLVFIGAILEGKSGMTIALVIAFGMNFFAYWFSDRIVLKMYGARQVTEAEAPEIYGMVGRLASMAQVPMPKVYLMDADQPNAFATGRNPQHGAVAITTGLKRILTKEELEGVIGHELAHIKHRDILVGTVAATIAGAISYLAQMAQWAALFGGGRQDEAERRQPISLIGHDDCRSHRSDVSPDGDFSFKGIWGRRGWSSDRRQPVISCKGTRKIAHGIPKDSNGSQSCDITYVHS